MAYPPLATLSDLLTQIDTGGPNSNSSASDLYLAIQQLQNFLYSFLGTSLDDAGSIRSGALTQTAFPTNAVPASAIAGQITTNQIAASAITNALLDIYSSSIAGSGAVNKNVCQPGFVDTSLLADQSVTAAKLADGAIDSSAKIGSGVVTAANIASGVIPSGFGASSITADMLKVQGTGSDAYIFFAIGASQYYAKVAGLSFVYDSSTNTVTLTPTSLGAEAITGRFNVTDTGTNVAGTATGRDNWTRVSGDGSVFDVDATDLRRINMKIVGTYFVTFSLSMYSVETCKLGLALNSTIIAESPIVFIPLGSQQDVRGACVVTTQYTTDYLELVYTASRAQAGNGLGYTPTGFTGNFGDITIIRIA